MLSNETIIAIGDAHKKTAAQVLIRWAIDSGFVSIPKSSKPERVQQNFDVRDFKLSEEEMNKIAELDCGKRLFLQDWMGVPCFE